jgi:peptide/nickel transport system substrate-binding protein
LRRALMGAIDQREFMIAMMGEDASLWTVPIGYFPPASALANNAGMSALTGPRDHAAVKTALEKAGYQGETVVLMGATDQPANYPLAEVAADMLKRVGMKVDYQATDWGTLVQRRALTKPPAEGGWNLFCTGFSGLDHFIPASHLALRGNGKNAWFGWPTLPKVEELRDAWFNAPDLAAQKSIGMQIQRQAFEDVPYYPLGLAQLPTAFRPDITGVPEGFAIFWNVRRA